MRDELGRGRGAAGGEEQGRGPSWKELRGHAPQAITAWSRSRLLAAAQLLEETTDRQAAQEQGEGRRDGGRTEGGGITSKVRSPAPGLEPVPGNSVVRSTPSSGEFIR